MEQNSDLSSGPAAGQKAGAVGSTNLTVEAAADLERAIGAAERNGPPPNVDPRIHEAMIEAMRSELAELRSQIDAR